MTTAFKNTLNQRGRLSCNSGDPKYGTYKMNRINLHLAKQEGSADPDIQLSIQRAQELVPDHISLY